MIRAHVDAVLALLAPLQAAPTNLPVFDGSVDGDDVPPTGGAAPATPYVVVRSDTMPLSSDRLGQYSNRLDGRIYVTGVGLDVREAAWALEKVRSALLDAVPVVAGRSLAPLELDIGQPIETDRDTHPPLFYGVDIYRLMSV